MLLHHNLSCITRHRGLKKKHSSSNDRYFSKPQNSYLRVTFELRMNFYLWILLLSFWVFSCQNPDLKAIEEAPLLTIRFKDDVQTEIVLQSPPQRIISFSAQLTELLVNLGLSNRLIAVSDNFHGDLPESVVRFALGNIQAEAELATLNPDCIVFGLNSFLPKEKPNLGFWKRQGVSVVTLQTEHLEDIQKAIEKVGILAAEPLAAQTLKDSLLRFQQNIIQQAKDLAKYSTVCLFSITPLGVLGKNHWLPEQLPSLGGKSATQNVSGSFSAVSVDSLIHWNPEYLLIFSADNQFLAELISAYPALENLQAVEKKQVFLFPPNAALVPGISSFRLQAQVAQSLHTQVSF